MPSLVALRRSRLTTQPSLNLPSHKQRLRASDALLPTPLSLHLTTGTARFHRRPTPHDPERATAVILRAHNSLKRVGKTRITAKYSEENALDAENALGGPHDWLYGQQAAAAILAKP